MSILRRRSGAMRRYAGRCGATACSAAVVTDGSISPGHRTEGPGVEPSVGTLKRMGILDRALNIGEAKQFRQYEKRVARIGDYEPELELESDDELRERMDVLRERAQNGESLDDLLPETFAIVREAGRRTMGMRHFDVQLIGGMVLHGGNIAEMKTGEGKTLTATLPVVLN